MNYIVRIMILRYNTNYYKFLLLSHIIYHISELIHTQNNFIIIRP